MSDFNRLILVGHLTVDPVIKLVGDNALAQFAVACNRRSKKKDGTVAEDVTFVDIEAWGQLSDVANKYLKKGVSCLLEGRLRQAQWQAKDGTNRSKLIMVCEGITLLDSGSTEKKVMAMREPRDASIKDTVVKDSGVKVASETRVSDFKKPSNESVSATPVSDLDDLPF